MRTIVVMPNPYKRVMRIQLDNPLDGTAAFIDISPEQAKRLAEDILVGIDKSFPNEKEDNAALSD